MKFCVVGLGYVGLPLAIKLAQKNIKIIGHDIDKTLIRNLKKGVDITNEVTLKNFHKLKNLSFSSNIDFFHDIDVFIVTLPTPVDNHNVPDLSHVVDATKKIALNLKKNSLIVFESTFYPGFTDETLVPILEKYSGLKINKDFYCGYSPERINPGDKDHTFENTTKLISGSSKLALNKLHKIYAEILKLKVYKCESIIIAESAKVIENIQRDLNIALVNELSIIFRRLNINTYKVLEAAKTKWNFLDFKPGLVGGHCIGVDPYYLTYKSEGNNYSPQVILAGRKINDNMGRYVAREIIKILNKSNLYPKKTKIIIFGFTFKENCPDTRNSKITDIFYELKNFGFSSRIYDPYINSYASDDNINNALIKNRNKIGKYDLAIFAVAHDDFKVITKNYLSNILKSDKSIIFDIKNIFINKNFINNYQYFSL